MALEVVGKLHKVFDTEQKTETFRTREFVIETIENYPQFVKFQATQDRCNIIDGYNEGEEIKVSFNLRGREWQGKFFTNLDAWRVEKNSGTSNQAQGEVDEFNQDTPAGNEPPIDSREDLDDLPF
ncbi:MAG: DUF3127 domain-containing protein [Bacteroidetes bacterium]|nr:DUF3127 domain-containing protein [Bacteroidota bacterium]